MLLQVNGLRVDYGSEDRPNHGVIDASFAVEAGEIVGLIGESGSGKSSAVLAVMGLARSNGRIVGGSVMFDGKEMLSLSEREWREYRGARIALVTQNPRASLNPLLRIGQQIVNVYRSHRKASAAEATERALSLLALMGINDPERRFRAFPHELSGGMAQRALIAMALSCEPKLLIADEPTSGLDATVQAQVLDDLRKAVTMLGTSVLLVTHDLGVVANYCDRVYLLESGEIVEEADIETFFIRSAHPAGRSMLAAQVEAELHQGWVKGRPDDRVQLPRGCVLHPRCEFADEASGCMTDHPPLYEVAPGHRSRCHRYKLIQVAHDGNETRVS